MSTTKSQKATNVFSRFMEIKNLSNLEEMADFIGLNYSTLRNQKSRGTIPYDLIVKNCDNEELVYVLKGDKGVNDHEFMSIPFHAAVRASAGTGLIADERRAPISIKLRSYYIKNTLRTQASSLFGIIAKGDSMLPDIQDGDLVIIDQSKNSIREHLIYAVRIDEEVYIKKISHRPGRRIVLISSNKEYPVFEVNLDDPNFGIIGTVVNLSRTLI